MNPKKLAKNAWNKHDNRYNTPIDNEAIEFTRSEIERDSEHDDEIKITTQNDSHATDHYFLRANTKHEFDDTIYNTEFGDQFKITMNKKKRKVNMSKLDGFEFTARSKRIGLKKGQRTLHFTRPENPNAPEGIFDIPLREDGRLNPDDPDEIPYNTKFIKQVLTRQDVINSHPDIDFISKFAASLSLYPEDVFVEESLTRKQAAASAMLDVVNARQQARAAKLSNFSKIIDNNESKKQDAERKLDYLFSHVSKNNLNEMKALRDEYIHIMEESDFINIFYNFIAILDSLAIDDGKTKTLSEIADDEESMEAIEMYLQVISPNNETTATKNILEYYRSGETAVNMVNSSLIVFAIVDFLATLVITFPDIFILKKKSIVKVENGETILNFSVPKRESSWKKMDLSYVSDVILSKSKSETDDIADDEINTIKKTFIPNGEYKDNYQIFKDIKNGNFWKKHNKDPTWLSKHISKLNGYFNHFVDLLKESNIYVNDVTLKNVIHELLNVSLEEIDHYSKLKEDHIRSIFSYMINESFVVVLDKYDVLNIFTEENIDDDGNFDIDLDFTFSKFNDFLEKFENEVKKLKNIITSTSLVLKDIEAQIDSLSKTGLGVGDKEINIPFRSSLEWALKPINTGRLDLAPWALAAIDAGHSSFNVYVARGKKNHWRKINREVLQRDELMAPFFAEFCGTFVNKAKIANPRRYMRKSSKKELLLERTSLIKSMRDNFVYNRRQKKFVAKL